MHAETFNEGPRQAAYLMSGMGNTQFPISTKNPMAQRFFDQGIAQLHGFWYFEAERSFRQAASIDPDHPMHYWGMARANIENRTRSFGFIEQAISRIAKANDKEKRLIEAWKNRVQPFDGEVKKPIDPKESKAARRARDRQDSQRQKQEQERLKDYANALEGIAQDFPDDIEIKAMLVLQLWQNDGAGIPIQSHAAIDALLSEIFRINPRHPAHHFRIHLWDYRKEKLAIDAAANCGPSAPGIAHMWHMPGHTYSRLRRYADAAWQQEASARVDHAHMIRDRVLPDQIHNYAHNNEWLIRSLNLIGRVDRAIEVAKNMSELPRHPEYNMLGESGSANYGRERLIQTLVAYGRWQQLLELTATAYLGETGVPYLDDERLAWQSIAALQTQAPELAREKKGQLESSRDTLHAAIRESAKQLQRLESEAAANPEKSDSEKANSEKPKPEKESRPRPPKLEAIRDWGDEWFGDEDDPNLPKPISREYREPRDNKWTQERKDLEKKHHEDRYRLQRIEFWLKAVEAYEFAAAGKYAEALRSSHYARPVIQSLVRTEWLALAGQKQPALEKLERRIQDGQGELLPLAVGAWVASQVPGKEERTKEWLLQLAPLARHADSGVAVLERLAPIVDRLGVRSQWEEQPVSPKDIGNRPALDALGPLRWTPPSAPLWYAVDVEGKGVSDQQFAGKPYIAILYLGFGCLHCAEQLTEFSPKVEAFSKLGIQVIGISTETPAKLREGIRNYDGEMKVQLFSNAEHDAFRAFRAYDDFEGLPLHGTFLIDAHGKVRWQDIGYQPFMNVDFLLEESKRLLSLEQK